jgi:alpha-beta hydrolase superfamily lysophospholipase
MNTLADEINARGVYATAHSHTDWKSLADKAAADYKAGKEGPIILIGHSLGADAVMEMADYLGDKGVPVALVVPFDGTQSFPASANIARVVNLTQRDYARMRPGPGFRGSLNNVDLSSDPSIDHLNIDKSPRLHARVIDEVLAVVGGRPVAPAAAKPAAGAPATPANGAAKATDGTKTEAGSSQPVIALPEAREAPTSAAAPAATPPPPNPVVPPRPVNPVQIPD